MCRACACSLPVWSIYSARTRSRHAARAHLRGMPGRGCPLTAHGRAARAAPSHALRVSRSKPASISQILILFFYMLKRMCPFGIRTYCLRSFQYWRPRGRRYVERWRAGRCRATPPFASEYGVSVLVRRQKKGRWWGRVAPFTVPSLSPSPLPCWLVLRSCVAF